MAHQRHEIPTHLNVEDKAFYGLSARQFTCLTVGLATSYGLWIQWPVLPVAARLALAAACFALAAALALVRPHGRGLEEWAFVALRYAALPKACVWRPGEPDPAAWRPAASHWAELSPLPAWAAVYEITREEGQR